MAIHFHNEPGWRPPWAAMVDLVNRVSHEQAGERELAWLRTHPVDWLMVTKYLRVRAENHIADTRRHLKEIPVHDPGSNQTSRAYLKAKAEADILNARRNRWIAGIDAQINEAKYLIGYDGIPADNTAMLVERLLLAQAALATHAVDTGRALTIIEGLITTFTGIDPNAYRPPAPPAD